MTVGPTPRLLPKHCPPKTRPLSCQNNPLQTDILTISPPTTTLASVFPGPHMLHDLEFSQTPAEWPLRLPFHGSTSLQRGLSTSLGEAGLLSVCSSAEQDTRRPSLQVLGETGWVARRKLALGTHHAEPRSMTPAVRVGRGPLLNDEGPINLSGWV